MHDKPGYARSLGSDLVAKYFFCITQSPSPPRKKDSQVFFKNSIDNSVGYTL